MAILHARHLRKSFRKRQVLKDVSFKVEAAEIVGLLGPNGAGKSTSFNIVAGLLRADAGEVCLAGQAIDRLSLHKRVRLGMAYLPQAPTVFRGLTVLQNLLAVLELHGGKPAQQRHRAEELIADFRLQHVRDTPGASLSGGERRRVEMARALIAQPKVMLLDEPFAGIDPIAVNEIKIFIRDLRHRGMAILLTDHNVRETLSACDRAYIISEGRILLEGTPEQIVADSTARQTYLGNDFQL
ncbi:MAG: LPS export ABC transporter ATP-binding protein [Myxococcota bacterium]